MDWDRVNREELKKMCLRSQSEEMYVGEGDLVNPTEIFDSVTWFYSHFIEVTSLDEKTVVKFKLNFLFTREKSHKKYSTSTFTKVSSVMN